VFFLRRAVAFTSAINKMPLRLETSALFTGGRYGSAQRIIAHDHDIVIAAPDLVRHLHVTW